MTSQRECRNPKCDREVGETDWDDGGVLYCSWECETYTENLQQEARLARLNPPR